MSLGKIRTHAPIWLAAGAMAIFIAACGSSATPVPTAVPVPATVSVASTSKGNALVGPNGRTLYTFDKDTTPGATACTSAGCLGAWPPLVATGTPTAGAGASGALTTFVRSDGPTQVSYGGKPLYYYTPDTKAGDVTGDGVGGVWHIATP
jgi:predicted lipoprotein with Yx(FWY)xxD motif